MVEGVAPLTGQTRTEPLPHQQGLRFATNFGTQVIVAFIGAFLFGQGGPVSDKAKRC